MKRRMLILALIFFAIALFFSTPCSAEWNRTDKVLYGGLIGLMAIDYHQTSQFREKGICEINPILREKDCYPDLNRLFLVQATYIASVGVIGHYFPKYRRGILIGATIGESGIVMWNFSLRY